MRNGIIGCNRAIEMGTALPQVSSAHQANARRAMSDCKRHRLRLLFGHRKDLSDSFAQSVAVKSHEAWNHGGIDSRKEYQRIFGRLSLGLGLFDQQMSALHGRLGFIRGKSTDVDECIY